VSEGLNISQYLPSAFDQQTSNIGPATITNDPKQSYEFHTQCVVQCLGSLILITRPRWISLSAVRLQGGKVRFIILFLILATSNLSLANENKLITKPVDSLVELVSDIYSSEFSREIYDIEKNNLKAVFFTIEGFGGGNNWQRYLAIYEKSIKRKQEPPFEPTGEEKYKLIGYLIVAIKNNNSIAEESFSYKNRKLTIPSFSQRPGKRNQKIDDIVINIKAHSLEVVSGIN